MADDTNLANPFIQGMLSGQQFQMNQFLIQEAPVKLEKEKLALKVAQTDFDARQKMAQMLSQHSQLVPQGQNPLTNASETLVEMGEMAAKSGLPEEAVTDFSKASTIMAQQEEAAYKQWQITENKAKFATQILGMSTDQASLDQANAYIKMSTGTPSALEGMKYSPELIESLRKSIAAKRTEAQESLDRARAAKERVSTQLDQAKIPLTESQIRLNDARADAAAKVGGSGIIAKPKNVSAVADRIRAVIGEDDITATQARDLARSIALDAEDRMDTEHKTQPEAVEAAVQYAMKHGELAGFNRQHVGPGASQKKPLPLPKAATEFKDQKWYQAPDGPRWYDAETQSLYKEGEGPGDEEEDEDK